jgi:uncharacterized protein (TIGR00645 family)
MMSEKKLKDNFLERNFEKGLFASRWLLAPFYVTLVVTLAVLLLKAVQELWHFLGHAFSATESETILAVLSLIDLTLTGSLILIVIFSGYENFVSKIQHSDHEDWPEWMSKIDFSGLKLKLLSSIVAISSIHLLKAFLDAGDLSTEKLIMLVVIHMTFIVSALMLAYLDKMVGIKQAAKDAAEP